MAGENSSDSVAENPLAGATKAVGIGEKAGCCCLNLGCLLSTLIVLALVAMIVKVVSNPLEALGAVLSGIWKAFTGN